jgi:predicted O-methyltransferase YrrM
MPDLAVIVPTRGRPENIRRLIGAWDFTNAWDSADLILVVDADDPEVDGYHQILREFVEAGCRGLQIVHIERWIPMVHKLDLAARTAAETYWAVGFAGDDHLPQTIGWAARYLTVLRELGTGMVYGDDGYQGVKLSTEWAVTSDAVRALGRMVPAPVEHMFCDNAIMELFTMVGAIRHLPEIRIEHRHPYAGKAVSDSQYERVNSRDQMGRDQRTFRKWQAMTLPGQAAKIQALRRHMQPVKPARPPRTARQQGRATMKPPRFFKQVRAATPEPVMMALADFATQVPADQEIVEIGVFHGRTALQLAWGARQGHGAHVTAVDPWDLPGNTYGPPFTDPGSRRWAYHHVQSLGFTRDITLIHAFSHDAAAQYNGPPVGLLFIDGDHSKDGAMCDVMNWAPRLAEGARIAVDDYEHPDWPGVKEALDDLVAMGVLVPVEVFHDHLAVTRLTETRGVVPGPTTAVTSEGVHPSPEPDRAEWREVDPEGVAALERSAAELHEFNRNVVAGEELRGVAEGTPIEELTVAQLRMLAKTRGVVLGSRTHKRAEIMDALRTGR